jgi:hypothetical protein
LIGGLVLQAVAFAVFLGILGRFWVVARREGFRARHVPEGWTRVVLAVGVSSVLIMVCALFACCCWDCVCWGERVWIGFGVADTNTTDTLHLPRGRVCGRHGGIFVQPRVAVLGL